LNEIKQGGFAKTFSVLFHIQAILLEFNTIVHFMYVLTCIVSTWPFSICSLFPQKYEISTKFYQNNILQIKIHEAL